ncbi:uncharacterized protein LOC112506102 [Cynara cardunculus var. scolymus]|uniref:uncharacterized protein LOC112506102 n=1 Tax=Cynara cardunculus var. scolymus TaxID=59895 RepID=UPI000D6304A4|nr:uncharacterized protein LOC112506102 [Cynara cardunculus var. scolymus]
MVLQILSVDQLFGYCSRAISREGEIRSDAGPSTAVVASLPAAPTTDKDEAEAPRAEADANVVNEIPTSYEALAPEEVDVVRADTKARDDDLPITYATNAGDVEDDDEEDDDENGESPDLPDSDSELDDDDFTI